MTDSSTQDADAPAAVPADATAAGSAGFGAQLAQAREAQGLSIPEVAARLRLHPKQVAALEQERLDKLPEPAFVRGFLRNYAKELRLDPAPLLAALAERQAPPDEIPTMIGGPPADVRRALVERSSRLTVIVGVVILIVVLGIIGWVASSRMARVDGSAPPAKASGAVASPGASATAATHGATQATAAAADDAAAATAVAATTPAGGAGSSGAVPAPVTIAVVSPAAASPAGAATQQVSADQSAIAAATKSPPPRAATPAGAALLRIAVGDRPSWVEITQADGKVLLTGLQEAGTERRIGPVQPPLRLVIGNASSVTLEYKGRGIDLQPHVRANDLARLSLD